MILIFARVFWEIIYTYAPPPTMHWFFHFAYRTCNVLVANNDVINDALDKGD